MVVSQQPDAISLLGNMRHLLLTAVTADVTLTPRLTDTGETLTPLTYSPDDAGRIDLDLKAVVEDSLQFSLTDATTPWRQQLLARPAEVLITSGAEQATVSFTVVRGAVRGLADSAQNFLTQNFLTWQPTLKPVTFYQPEYLTYFATTQQSVVKCRAYSASGAVVKTGTLCTIPALQCYTIPTGYEVIMARLGIDTTGDASQLPSYYDVWVETSGGTRLTYVQRYYASALKSEQEQWFLFENSLGGVDTLRAYGNHQLKADHSHQLAEIDDQATEYRVDTKRTYTKSTGLIDNYERRWLLDFMPSLAKYVYDRGTLRRIVVTEDETAYSERELPSEYTFTYKMADTQPALNLPRTDATLTEMRITIPDIGSFTIAPRLVEFSRQQLTDNVLFPVQSPYSETWGTTTWAAVRDAVLLQAMGIVSDAIDEALILPLSELNALAERMSKAETDIKDKLSRTTDDEAHGNIGFLKGLWVKAKGLFGIDADGNATLNDVTASGNVTATGNATVDGLLTALRSVINHAQSNNYTGGELTGTGWRLTADDGSGRSKLEVDNIVARMKFVASVLEARKYVALGGNYVYSPAASVIERVDYYDDEDHLMGYETLNMPWILQKMPMWIASKLMSRKKMVKVAISDEQKAQADYFRCWIKADDGTTKTVNTWQAGMLARCQTMDVSESSDGTHSSTVNGVTSAQNKYYWRKVVCAGLGTLPIRDGHIHAYADLANDAGNYDSGSDLPSVGDSIVCFGATKKEWSHVIMIETVGTDAPAFKELRGVGLQDITRDNTATELPRFSTEGRQFTKISPSTGNDFFAPHFYIETTGEELRNENTRGKAKGAHLRPDMLVVKAAVGDTYLYDYTDFYGETVKHILVCTGIVEMLPQFEARKVNIGDCYILESESKTATANGHLFCATPTGWQDKGLVTESKSSLKVEIDGITATVTEQGVSITQLAVRADSVESTVTNLSKEVNSENLFTGLDDGDGWTYDDYEDHIFTSAELIVSPTMHLKAGHYTLRFTTDEAGTQPPSATVTVYVDGEADTSSEIDDFRSHEYTLEFDLAADADVYVDWDLLVYGNYAFGITNPVIVWENAATYSRIRQTAESIEATIVNKLGETGIKIDGTNRQIQAKADQFEIQNSSGQTTMTIDDEGNIVGNGSAAFKGDIRAKNVYRASQRVSGDQAPASGTTPIGVDVEDGVSLIYIRRINSTGSYNTNFQLNLPLPSENQGRVIDIYNGEANTSGSYTKTIKIDCYIDGQRYIYPVSSTVESAYAMPQEIQDYDHVLLFTERVTVGDSDVWVWRCLKDKVKGRDASININGYTYNFIDGVLYNIIAP